MKFKRAVVVVVVSAAAMMGVGGLRAAEAGPLVESAWARACDRAGGVTANSQTTLNCVKEAPATFDDKGKRALTLVCHLAGGSVDVEDSVVACVLIPTVWNNTCERAGGATANSASTLNCFKEAPATFDNRSKRALVRVCNSIGGVVDVEDSIVACVWNP